MDKTTKYLKLTIAFIVVLNYAQNIKCAVFISPKLWEVRSPNISVSRVRRSILNVITDPSLFLGTVVNNVENQVFSGVVDIIPHLMAYSFKPTKVPALITDPPSNSKHVDNIIKQYTSGTGNEDAKLDIEQLVRKYGHEIERHEVQTKDGYVLTLFRIPRYGPAVFLMHGLLCSADDWITPGPASGLGYLLAAEGYDVWLGNARGNKHSRRHARLSPDSAQFWDFSWDEIGRHDLPAMIDHVLHVTGLPQLLYVGHSQGTTAFFVMCSERPEYNDKISLMVALSAVAWMSHLRSPIVRLLSPINPLLYSVSKLAGVHEFLPDNDLIKTLKRTLCGEKELAEIICGNIIFLLCGFDHDQLNATNLPVLMAHVPAGAATKQLTHYAQGVVSGKFQRFDYGKSKNKEVYNSSDPPEYSVEKISAPVAIFYSKEDWLASVTDVQMLRNQLQNLVEFYRIPFEKFNHLDFIWAKDVKELVFKKLLELLERH